MDDLISRQAAIEELECVGYDFSESGLSNPELEELCEAIGEVEQDMIMRIRHLPSAQPTQSNTTQCVQSVGSVGDAISRQDAIDAAERESTRFGAYGYMDTKSIIDMLNDLPSAQRKGKWVYLTGLDAFECSVCGSAMVRNIFNFCPWCGAEMKGEEDETD